MDRSLVERIRSLETHVRVLEPDREARAAVRSRILEYTEKFLDELHALPTFIVDEAADGEDPLPGPSDEPTEPERLVRALERRVDARGVNPASGGHLGYVPGGGLPHSALGDYIAAVTNRYAGIAFAGPGAVEMEELLLRWMAGIVGFPEDAGGNLASGGSVANLVAIVTAREAHGLRAADFPRSVVYTTEQVHHCVDKALGIAGMTESVRRRVRVDERYRMDPDALDAAIREDRARGLRPWLVVASAGTTDVGAVDPLGAVADLAREHGLWYHVDAAYGGFFALCPSVAPLLAGMEEADSIVLDPHKGLFVPYGLGAVLVRDDRTLVRAHRYQAAYMQDAPEPESRGARSPASRSPELSCHWRGPRMWLPLLLHGVAPFRAALEEKLLLARYFHQEVASLGFETGPEPDLSLATYRWIPERGDANAFNRALVEAIHRDGRVFISSTTLDETVWLRACVLSFRTHLDTIDLTLRILRGKVEELLGSSPPGAAEAGRAGTGPDRGTPKAAAGSGHRPGRTDGGSGSP